MEENNTIDVRNLSEEEREVLFLLEKAGKCLYGNIFKELNLTQTKGAPIIYSLLTKGYIKSIGTSSYYELNGKLTK